MRILVKVKAGAKENKVIPPVPRLLDVEDEKSYFAVFVKELPINGKANDSVIKALAEYFSVTLSQVKLLRGSSSKIKVFEIYN